MDDTKPPSPPVPKRRKADDAAARKARLARALRENLRRRRAQAQARKGTPAKR